jgi:cation diffusion facilitator CzcD-associated flavoprotein CzcO
MENIVDVVVVGAGVSGLATAKTALDAGLGVVVLEKSGHVGGVWHYDEKGYGVMNFTHM